jgi:hypothetical protein
LRVSAGRGLASPDEARFVTGQSLLADAGFTIDGLQ